MRAATGTAPGGRFVMRPEFSTLDDPSGVRITDPIENAKLDVYAEVSSISDPEQDRFLYPTDAAIEVTTDRIRIPRLLNVYVRDTNGQLVGESSNRETLFVEHGTYDLDVSSGELKLYLGVTSALSITRNDLQTVIQFPDPVDVRLGVRSLHQHPATTITIRDRIEDVMDAVSYLGSALKTTTPERSFPTLRGHPPLIEFGDDRHIPADLERPDTDVTLELPPKCRYVYPASTLAYYLGAELVPADAPALVVADTRFDIPSGPDYEDAIGRLMQRIFFMDCLVRSEGLYPVDLHERREFEANADLDLTALYDAPEADRLAAYLDVPYEDIEPLLPTWKVTTDIEPTVQNADVLPFVANDLSLVRCPTDAEEPAVFDEPPALANFYREDGGDTGTGGTRGTGTGGGTGTGTGLYRTTVDDVTSTSDRIIRPEPVESLEHAWVGDGFPLGASKVTSESYRRRLEHVAGETPYIDVHIVCNDPEMSEEDVVQDYYGVRDFFQFDVEVSYELTTAELADVLAEGCDFFHYIGHVDSAGFECADGRLDASDLDEVDIAAFLLNACRSYEQGAALVEKGSLGGIVTLAKVLNEPAVRVGRTLAKALNSGYSLQSALAIARHTSRIGDQYITIGDGNLQLVKSQTGTSFLGHLTTHGDGVGTLSLVTYPSSVLGMGSMVTPHIRGNTTKYLNSGWIDDFEVQAAELEAFFELGVVPVLVDGQLYWSDEVTASELL